MNHRIQVSRAFVALTLVMSIGACGGSRQDVGRGLMVGAVVVGALGVRAMQPRCVSRDVEGRCERREGGDVEAGEAAVATAAGMAIAGGTLYVSGRSKPPPTPTTAPASASHL